MDNMVYNSDAFVVIELVVPAETSEAEREASGGLALARGGYEIVDKLARQEIYLEGLLAQHFRDGVTALAQQDPTTEQVDEFIAGFAGLPRQPLTLH